MAEPVIEKSMTEGLPPTDFTLPETVAWAARFASTGAPSSTVPVTNDVAVVTGPFSTTGTSVLGLLLVSVTTQVPPV